MPFIFYVVSAKYNTNQVGLKSIHKKIFTEDTFSESRKQAFEYYESFIEMLADSGEITFENYNLNLPTKRKNIKSLIANCNTETVKYKDSENFDCGIQIHLRINKNLSLSENNVITEGKKYLIQEFNCLDLKSIQTIEENLLQEVKIYERFRNQETNIYSYNTISENGYEKEIRTLFSYNRFLNSKACLEFNEKLTKKQKSIARKEVEELLKTQDAMRFEQMNEHNMIELGQTVCAFLNGNEVAYIHLNYDAQHPFFLKATMEVLREQFLEDLPYVQLFDDVRINRKRYIIIRIDGSNSPHNITRVAPKPSNKIEDYEVYHRTPSGNVLIIED